MAHLTTPTPEPATTSDEPISGSGQVEVIHRSPTKRKGFAQIPHAVLTDPELSDAAVRLYGVLLSYAFQADSFKCSQEKMGQDTGKEDRTIRRLLKELHQRGLVTPIRQGQRMVNIYILEDAYALYDSEKPEPKKRTRIAVGTQAKIPIGPDKNVRSENAKSDRTKMSSPGGQKCPVMQDKNVLLLNTPENNKDKETKIPASQAQNPGLNPGGSAKARAKKHQPLSHEPASGQSDRTQSDQTLASYSSILLNILEKAGPKPKTAQAPEPETAPAPLPSWDGLGEAQQRPYLAQAEAELLDLYTETHTQTHTGKPSRRIVLSRARSLYQKTGGGAVEARTIRAGGTISV